MSIPGGIEVFFVPVLFLLALLGLVGKYVLKWFREGYDAELEEKRETGPSE